MINFFFTNPLFLDFSTIICLILLGVYLRAINFIDEEKHRFLIELVLQILLPSMILISFMRDTSVEMIKSGFSIFVWGMIVHTILFISGKLYYKHKKGLSPDEKIILQNFIIVGSTSTFGLASVSIFYGEDGIFANNIFNIATRIFIYTVCFISISGLKKQKGQMQQIFKNPVMITTIIGMIIFFTQDLVPQIEIQNKMVSILRIDHTLPLLYNPIKSLSNAFLPLIWLIIGASLERDTLKFAVKSKCTLIFSILKILICPLLLIGFYIILRYFHIFAISTRFIAPTLLLLICPPANIVIVFSLKYYRAPKLALACFLISNILAIILLPFYTLLFAYLIKLNLL